jgi:hypothetical protein
MFHLLKSSDGGKVLLSGRDDGSAVLLSGLVIPLIEVKALMSVSEVAVADATSPTVQALIEGAVQFVTSVSVQGMSDVGVPDVTRELAWQTYLNLKTLFRVRVA